jgi:hypothetical protein
MLFNILHFLLLTLVEKYLYYGEKIWHFWWYILQVFAYESCCIFE